MVRPLFDTNVLVDYLNAVPEARVELQRYPRKAISIITWMEVMVGAGNDVEILHPRLNSRHVNVKRSFFTDDYGPPHGGSPERTADGSRMWANSADFC